jgi:multiple sugar transport system substrate-binding protein
MITKHKLAAFALVAATTVGAAAASAGAASAPNKAPLTLLFGSSGPAETAAVNAAAKAFAAQSGIKVNVVPAANLSQELAQDFSGNQAPNLFYLDPTSFQEYVTKGVLDSYGQSLPNAKDFYPSLKAAFTYKNQLVCDPKDASALSLYINKSDWKAAGLTSADYPTTWTKLAADAKKLTTSGRYGLTIDPNESRLDAFFYQAGGSVFNPAGTRAVIDSPANIRALTFIKSMLANKTLAFPATVNESDETTAFGANKAAMVVTGNWIQGVMTSDYPTVAYQALPLPAGPGGDKGTLTFTNCWGVAKQNKNLSGTIAFVRFLTSPAQQMLFTKAFGVVPSLETLSGAYAKDYPQDAEVVQALKIGHPDIALAGSTEALSAYNSALAQLGSTAPSSILASAQQNLQAVIAQNG